MVHAGFDRSVTDLHPLVNGLRRLRNPYEFYGPESAIVEKSYADYVAIVTKMGHNEGEAEFLFRKVRIESDWSTARDSGLALFRDALCKELPCFRDVSNRVIDDAYAALATFVRSRRNEPVERRELEAKLWEFLPVEQRSLAPPMRMHTEFNERNPASKNELLFRWAKFFGGRTACLPAARGVERWAHAGTTRHQGMDARAQVQASHSPEREPPSVCLSPLATSSPQLQASPSTWFLEMKQSGPPMLILDLIRPLMR